MNGLLPIRRTGAVRKFLQYNRPVRQQCIINSHGATYTTHTGSSRISTPPQAQRVTCTGSHRWFGFGIIVCAALCAPLWYRVPNNEPKGPESDEERTPEPESSRQKIEGIFDIFDKGQTKVDWRGLSFLKASAPIQSISSSISSWSWPALPTPDLQWPTSLAVSDIQERFSVLLLELARGPGSLYDEVVNEPPDLAINPECEWDAEVRLGDDLCIAERAFLGERKRKMKAAFARLMGVHESEVNEEDIPIVAIAGSGGGFRAMLNTLGSLSAAKSTGILDCTTYTAGVSGSCWALGVLYSGVSGSFAPKDAAAHAKDRLGTSYIDMATLDALITPPTNKYLLSGILRKAAGEEGTVSLVDLYGTLLASRLYVPSDLTRLDSRYLSLHFFRREVDNGNLPLPIFSAIQNIASPEQVEEMHALKEEKKSVLSGNDSAALEKKQQDVAHHVRWLWYEFTPYEVGCDETGAWVPSWALGRSFLDGKNTERKPELSFAILSGIFGSAFCASLKYYFKEVEPTLQVLPVQLYSWLKDIVTENERDLGLIHPVLPDQLPNFLKGLEGQLRRGSPPEITEQDTLSFMDTGAELNIPYYPFLRRNVDCIIALDASADSHELWFTRAEEIAAKRGLRTWPKGATWPARVYSEAGDSIKAPEEPSFEASTPESANLKLAQAQEAALAKQTDKEDPAGKQDMSGPPNEPDATGRSKPLTSCEVWIGSSSSSDEFSARLDDLDEQTLLQRDGIGVVYIPLVPNDRRVPGFDPFSISTWRREVKPEESQKLLDVAEANFTESREKIIRLLRAVWMRKRLERRRREWRKRLAHLREHLGGHTH